MHSAEVEPPAGRPRTRGDGPPHWPPRPKFRASAPHPRGWSSIGLLNGSLTPVGPAPAGMVPASVGTEPPARGRPRTRGDGPEARSTRSGHAGSAPHPRGWSAEGRRGLADAAVGPAPAGMVLRLGVSSGAVVGRPRTRGDGPPDAISHARLVESAPHPRGWSSLLISECAVSVVGPAPAGMALVFTTTRLLMCRRPRTRGDGPPCRTVRCLPRKSAPHPRGWSLLFYCDLVRS